MASSGSFSGSIVSGHYQLRVDWSQAQNVSANKKRHQKEFYLLIFSDNDLINVSDKLFRE